MLNILNTRPAHQSKNLTSLIKKSGGFVFELPLFEIQTVTLQPLKTDNFDIFIFLSANAVAHFFAQATLKINHAIIIAIGSATQRALNQLGYNHAIFPAIFSSEGILAMPILQNCSKKSIAIICGENPKPLLAKTLIERGAIIKTVFCYQRKPIIYDMDTIFPALFKSKINIIICTSLESLLHLITLFQAPNHRAWLLKNELCVISDDMRIAAKKAGFVSIIQADNATDEAIVKVLI